MDAFDLRNIQNMHDLVEAAVLRPSPASPESVDGAEALDRHTVDAELSLGEIDDHLADLRDIANDLRGHEYESERAVADAIEDAASRLEGML